MKKGIVAVIITVIAAVAVIGIVMANNKDDKASTSSSSTQGSNSTDTMNMPAAPLSSAKDQSVDTIQTGEVKLDIKDYAYSQKTVKVKKGTKVTWTNQDSVRHDVTPDSESAAFKASELLAQGESYSFTFDTVGNYSYHCSPHPYMKASIQVVE